MSDKNSNELRPISMFLTLKLCLVFGVSLGGVAAPFYAATYIGSGELTKAVLALFLTPIANGIVVVLYGLVGYPAYLFLWKRGGFGLNAIVSASPKGAEDKGPGSNVD